MLVELFGAAGRWVLRVLGPLWNLQVIYVDDLHIVVVGKDKFVVLWMALAAYELMGTPFAYHKFKGGLEVEFVGYSLSYKHACAGISPKRTAWVLGWIEEVKGNNWFVQGRRLHEFLGRLNFVARVLTWIKPFLAPIYAFNAVLKRGTVARLPEMVYLTLIFISEQLEASKGMQSWLLGRDHDPAVAPWFALEIFPGDLPFLFDEAQESERIEALPVCRPGNSWKPAELLGPSCFEAKAAAVQKMDEWQTLSMQMTRYFSQVPMITCMSSFQEPPMLESYTVWRLIH
eukprot:s9686_g1.t1